MQESLRINLSVLEWDATSPLPALGSFVQRPEQDEDDDPRSVKRGGAHVQRPQGAARALGSSLSSSFLSTTTTSSPHQGSFCSVWRAAGVRGCRGRVRCHSVSYVHLFISTQQHVRRGFRTTLSSVTLLCASLCPSTTGLRLGPLASVPVLVSRSLHVSRRGRGDEDRARVSLCPKVPFVSLLFRKVVAFWQKI